MHGLKILHILAAWSSWTLITVIKCYDSRNGGGWSPGWLCSWWRSSGWCTNETFRAWRRVQSPLMGSYACYASCMLVMLQPVWRCFFYIFEEEKRETSLISALISQRLAAFHTNTAPVRFISCFELPCQLHPYYSGITTTTTNMTSCKVKHCAVQALCFPRCIFRNVFALPWNALDKIYPSLHHCVHLLSPVLAGPCLAFTQPLHCYCKMWKWVWTWS